MSASVSILPNKVTIYRRRNSLKWQVRIRLKSGEWYRLSTGTDDYDEARESALKFYYTADYKEKNKLPQNTRKFAAVAKYAVERMQDALDEGSGRVVYKHYIQVINKYLIPFFGKMNVENITVKELNTYATWRDECIAQQNWESAVQAAKNKATNVEQLRAAKQIKKKSFKASQSTINTHNSALNRVFDEALFRGWITESIKPVLLNKGVKAESRGSFTFEEYQKVIALMRKWSLTGHQQHTREIREVLRNYILILANTGIRHGTEAANLKWKHVAWHIAKDGARYLTLSVDGKTKKRTLVARHQTQEYLFRQAKLNPALRDYETLDALLAAKRDDYVLVGSAGTRIDTTLMQRAFRKFLIQHDLLTGSDEKERSLYSLRHNYATAALLEGRDIHKLAVQMGTSVKMLEQYYSKVSPILNAEEHAGAAYKIPKPRAPKSTAKTKAKAKSAPSAKAAAKPLKKAAAKPAKKTAAKPSAA